MTTFKFTFVKPDGTHEETTSKAETSCLGAAKKWFESMYGPILKIEEVCNG